MPSDEDSIPWRLTWSGATGFPATSTICPTPRFSRRLPLTAIQCRIVKWSSDGPDATRRDLPAGRSGDSGVVLSGRAVRCARRLRQRSRKAPWLALEVDAVTPVELRRGMSGAGQLGMNAVHEVHLPLAFLGRHLAAEAAAEEVLDARIGSLRDVDPTRLSARLEARGEVHGIAPHVEGELVDPHHSRGDRAGVDPDAYGQRQRFGLGGLAHDVHDLEPGQHRIDRV